MFFKHGFTLLFTLLMSISLAGCLGGNGSSEADDSAADRGSENTDNPEANLELTDDFSVDAGPRIIFTDAGAVLDMEGKINNPNGVTIVESYWRLYFEDYGFRRVPASIQNSGDDNTYQLQTERRLAEATYVYQFVAVDAQGRVALDTVYLRVNPFTLSLTATLESQQATEGGNFYVTIELTDALAEDLILEFKLESETAIVGEDVADCSPCRVTVPAGETRVDVVLEALSDELEEGDETFKVVFTSYPEGFSGEPSVQLTIQDSESQQNVALVNFAEGDVDVNEKTGTVKIPLVVQSYYPLVVEDYVPLAGVTENTPAVGRAAVVDFAPAYIFVQYGGSATGGSDFVAEEVLELQFDENDNPYVELSILDDVINETDETIVITLLDGQDYFTLDQPSVTYSIQSDDVIHMATAANSYCTVEDHVGLRCWGDFIDGKTAIPNLSSIDKLVGASDYFCAMHSEEGSQMISCWGDVPGGTVSSKLMPIGSTVDIFVLDDRWCERINTQLTCYSDRQAENFFADFAQGAHQGFCLSGDGVFCDNESVSELVKSNLVSGGQFLLDTVSTIDQRQFQLACSRSDAGVICDGVQINLEMAALEMAAANIDFKLHICVIEGSTRNPVDNKLVCLDESGEPSTPFADQDIAIEQPYRLSSDFENNLCVSHLGGVDCLVKSNLEDQLPLVNINSQATALKAATGYGGDGLATLCGVQGGDVNCVVPGDTSYLPLTLPTPIAAVDFESNQPVVTTLLGDAYVFNNLFQAPQGTQLDFSGTVPGSELIASGNGIACAVINGLVECDAFNEIGFNLNPGDDVDNATQLAISETEVCAITAGVVWCWGSGAPEVKLPDVNDDFVAMDASDNSGCAVTDVTENSKTSEMYCWGNILEYIPNLNFNLVFVGEVQEVAVSDKRVCVRGSEGVNCWDETNSTDIYIETVNATDIAVSDEFSCVLDEQRVRCWGDYLAAD